MAVRREWYGWIAAPDDARAAMEAMGIQIKGKNADGDWLVELSEETMGRIQDHWGEWCWGLDSVVTVTGT